MTADPPVTASFVGGLTLLERALNYTLGSLLAITPDDMGRPTPCRDWDLRALLAHMNDSLVALSEAADLGHVDLAGATDADPEADPVGTLQARACRLVGAWTNARSAGMVSVSGQPLTADVVAATGALEITVHGWDVAQACGYDRPIPSSLAAELLELAGLFVTDADRPALFAAPVPVPPRAGLGNRLVAFLGRTPPSRRVGQT